MTARWPVAALMALALAGCAAPTAPACRAGFDIGSSGIRAGWDDGTAGGKVSIDYLADVWADNVIDQTNDATAEALTRLAAGRGCQGVAGGYSAWRLAVEKGGAGKVADTLADLHARTGTAIFVIPQAVEGSYGYLAAKRELGERLKTPFVLDVGGGSLQFAAPDTGWGAALGQKAWHKSFCAEVKGAPSGQCAANPVGAGAVEASRRVLAPLVSEARRALGGGFAVTAVSAPVVRGIHPILSHLAAGHPALRGHVDSTGFDRAGLEAAIALLAPLDDAGIVRVLGDCRDGAAAPFCTARFAGSFVTDMLLVDAFMAGLDIPRVEVAELDLTNVPGILADPRAAAWAGHYSCYLDRLRRDGVEAFTQSTGGCR